MAENKTEQPTEKRLRDARKRGEVFKSADLTHAFLFLGTSAVLALGGAMFIDQWKTFAVDSFSFRTIAAPLENGPLLHRTGLYLMKFFALIMPLLGVLVLIALAVNFLQVRALFATEVLALKFERMNPATGFRKMFFESRAYIEFAKTLVKLIVILWLAYLVLRGMFPGIMRSGRLQLSQIGSLGSHAAFILLFSIGGTFLLLGGADYFLQRKLYMKKMMMSKDEIKREHKREEGDPQIRARRRQIHREILTQNVVERVPQATALVVNPTHLAVAIRYDEKTMEAPEVTAKGQEQLAEKMIRLANEHGVPIVRNAPLAHSLFRLDVDTQIPEELYDAVAEILTWVYDLTQRDSL
ncbi:MAG: EscU/YscU/HrcU family type III secretion system export apparatus switch protein [Acidobacteriaceae bacterium]|nr:EscU/YscU/HrcU family type III secretion system export apparatus switch protein [Acidobacteriaceae bacterium]